MQEIAMKLMDLYCHCIWHYKKMLMNGDYYEPKGKITLPILMAHLEGREAISVFAWAKTTKFICFDVDKADKRTVRRVIDTLAEIGIDRDRVYVSLSGRKGYHVEVFFDTPVFNNYARDLYELVLYFGKISPEKIELRPTSKQAIKIPLGVNHKSGKRCWYVDRETLEPIEDMRYILGIEPESGERVSSIIVAKCRERKREMIAGMEVRAKEKPEKAKARYKEPVVTARGERHNLMLKYGMHLKNEGADEEAIYKGMLAWCARQPADLIGSTQDEIEKDARTMAGWISGHIDVVVRRTHEDEARIMPDDVRRFMSLGSRTSRRIGFMLYAMCRAHKQAALSYSMISEAVGCTVAMANRIINGFVDAGYFTRVSGGIRCVGNKLATIPNRYEIGGDWRPDSSMCASSFYDVDVTRLKTDFDGEYYGMLWHMCDERTLRKVLSRSEYAETKR